MTYNDLTEKKRRKKREGNCFHSVMADTFHKYLQRNGKKHTELNLKFWSSKTNIFFDFFFSALLDCWEISSDSPLI